VYPSLVKSRKSVGHLIQSEEGRSALLKIIIVDALVPDPLFGAGFPRAAKLLQFFASREDISIHLVSMTRKRMKRVDRTGLLPKGVKLTESMSQGKLKRQLLKLLKTADVIWVSRFPIYLKILDIRESNPKAFEGVRLIYDSECIESTRSRLQRIAVQSPMMEDEFNTLLRHEMQQACKADQVIAVSNLEKDIFQENGCKSVALVSHSADSVKELKSIGDRSGLLFVGRMVEENSPNVDGLRWFSDNCFPGLLQDGLTCRLVGAISEPLYEEFEEIGYEVTRPVVDLLPAYDAAMLFIAPTRYAAGIPIKIIEASAAGLPVVATRLLCDQLGWIPDVEMLVADSPQEFTNKIKMALADESLWHEIQYRAHQRVIKDFSALSFADSLNRVVTKMLVHAAEFRPLGG
jgi:glycosyltransferase involved in cell wall biosynthesis